MSPGKFTTLLSIIFLAGLPRAFAVPVRFLPWDADVAARKISVQDAKEVRPLTGLHPLKRSESMDLTKSGAPLRLLAMDRLDADGKPRFVEIKTPPELKSPLVLILADSMSDSGLRAFVIEETDTGFPWGAIRFINATPKPLVLRLENKVVGLPEGWAPVDLKPGGSVHNVGVQLAFQSDLKSVVYSAVWEQDPEVRKLVFIVPGNDSRTGVVELKIIPEDRRTLITQKNN